MEPTVARGSVLVVDDEPGLRDLLAWELSRDGYDIETAENGRLAVAAMRRRRFDLAITDLRMPEMDGVETVAALRAIDPDIEVIVATGYASVETAVSCMRSGAFDYVQKPYEMSELRLLLERAMQKSHLQGLVELYEVSRALLLPLRRGELEPLVLGLAQKLLHADAVCLAGVDGRSSIAQGGRMSASPELVRQLVALEGSSDLVVVAPDPRVPCLERAGFRNALVQRITLRDNSLGWLAMMRAGNPFNAGDLRRSNVFAAQVALALHNSRLCEALGSRVQELLRARENLAHAERLRTHDRRASDAARDLAGPLAHMGAMAGHIRDDLEGVRALIGAVREAAACPADGEPHAIAALFRSLHEATGSRKGLSDLAADLEQTAGEIDVGMGQIAGVLAQLRDMTGVVTGVGPTYRRSA